MARITVEDCVKHIPNRFSLVLTASERARKLANGEVKPLLERGNHKFTVVALYEIAAGYSFDEMEKLDDSTEETSDDGANRTILGSRTPFSSSLL